MLFQENPEVRGCPVAPSLVDDSNLGIVVLVRPFILEYKYVYIYIIYIYTVKISIICELGTPTQMASIVKNGMRTFGF